MQDITLTAFLKATNSIFSDTTKMMEIFGIPGLGSSYYPAWKRLENLGIVNDQTLDNIINAITTNEDAVNHALSFCYSMKNNEISINNISKLLYGAVKSGMHLVATELIRLLPTAKSQVARLILDSFEECTSKENYIKFLNGVDRTPEERDILESAHVY